MYTKLLYDNNYYKAIHEIVADATARCCAHYGQGSGSIRIRDVSCAGSESRVTDCLNLTSSSSDHSNDVGVQCQPGNNAHFEHYINFLTCSDQIEKVYLWRVEVQYIMHPTNIGLSNWKNIFIMRL